MLASCIMIIVDAEHSLSELGSVERLPENLCNSIWRVAECTTTKSTENSNVTTQLNCTGQYRLDFRFHEGTVGCPGIIHPRQLWPVDRSTRHNGNTKGFLQQRVPIFFRSSEHCDLLGE